MNYIVFHIPHSQTKIPKIFWDISIKNKNYIYNCNILLSDYLVDNLVPPHAHQIKFKYSRVFCDVEKIKDDNKEIMADKGMGVIYTKDLYNTITHPTKDYKDKIIKSYYDKYHNKVDKRITEILNKHYRCIIIDFHSYSDEQVLKLFNIDNTPDICIGTDINYTSYELFNFTIEHFKKYGYSVKENYPYVGTIIPNKYINKKKEGLLSIMIEINKRIYLDDDKNFKKIQECINDYYEKIKIMNF